MFSSAALRSGLVLSLYLITLVTLSSAQGDSEPPATPRISQFNCAPSPSGAGTVVRCSLQAEHDQELFFTVDWGDGSQPIRVPPTGYLSPGSAPGVRHTYNQSGSYKIQAWATDNREVPRASEPFTRNHTVELNTPPLIETFGCSPTPVRPYTDVWCRVRFTDALYSEITLTLDWGDGRPPLVIVWDEFQSHTWNYYTLSYDHKYYKTGRFTVKVNISDNGWPPLISDTLETTIDVVEDKPVMQEVSCQPEPSAVGQQLRCALSATDDSPALYYTVDWGDGSSLQRTPTKGTLGVDDVAYAYHVFQEAGTYHITVWASDDDMSPQRSEPMTMQHRVNNSGGSVEDIPRKPQLAQMTCSPNQVMVGDEVTCSWNASMKGSAPTMFVLNWGDGSTHNYSLSHAGNPWNPETATHAYPTPGDYTIEATAIDHMGNKSDLLNTTISVRGNAIPVIDEFRCQPEPEPSIRTLRCKLRASDEDSTRLVYWIAWGDGTPKERVPPEGHSLPGTSLSATHTYLQEGTYVISVNVTDDETLTHRESPTMNISHRINGAPLVNPQSAQTPALAPTAIMFAAVLLVLLQRRARQLPK